MEEAERRASAKLASLREEREACVKKLKEGKEKLAEIKETRQSRQLFSRLVRSRPSTAEAEKSVAELESKLEGLEREIERRRKARSDPAYIEAEKRFEAVRGRLLELQSSRQGRLQLAPEREAATQALSEIEPPPETWGGRPRAVRTREADSVAGPPSGSTLKDRAGRSFGGGGRDSGVGGLRRRSLRRGRRLLRGPRLQPPPRPPRRASPWRWSPHRP